MAPERRWLKVSEAAEYLGLYKRSVYRACQECKLPHAKVPGVGVRIDKQALDELLMRQSADRK